MKLTSCSNGHQVPIGARFCQQCGERLPVVKLETQGAAPTENQLEALPSGTRLRERYIIQQLVGQGGFGRTYVVIDTGRFNEKFAIKEFCPLDRGTYGLQKAEELFQREASTLHQLQHSQIPRFWETFREGSRIFIVEDFIEGETYDFLLKQRLQQGQYFSEKEILKLLKDLLPVLGYLHSQGVVHRDISPDNIILHTQDNLPILIDLGAVKQVAIQVTTQILGVQNSASSTSTRLGKIGYAPDEQLRFGIVAPHSDLYALAVTAIVLMTGKEPQDLIDQYTMCWMWERELTLSPLLKQIINRMLAPKPTDRFQSSNEILQAIEPLLSPDPLSSTKNVSVNGTGSNSKSAQTTRLNRFTKVLSSTKGRNRDTFFLVLALLVACGMLGSAIWRSIFDQTGKDPSADIQSANDRFANVQNVPSGLFSYGGSTTWAPIRSVVDPVLQTDWTGFRLLYTDPISGAPGSGTGIRMLIYNQMAFSQSSRPLKDKEHQQARQRGFSLKEIPVAIDGIAIAVNPSLNIPGLSIGQIKDIYTGKITNWSQVGGPNLQITPYSRRIEEGGTIEFFAENILEKQKFGTKVKFVLTTTQALQKVADNPGGIYYASAPEVVPQCTVKPLPIGRQPNSLIAPYQQPLVPSSQCPTKRNQLNVSAFQNGQYPITRRLFVIVKQNNQIDQQAGIAYANLLLTAQGQELITKAGFVRIR